MAPGSFDPARMIRESIRWIRKTYGGPGVPPMADLLANYSAIGTAFDKARPNPDADDGPGKVPA